VVGLISAVAGCLSYERTMNKKTKKTTAEAFANIARLLEIKGESPFRVRARFSRILARRLQPPPRPLFLYRRRPMDNRAPAAVKKIKKT